MALHHDKIVYSNSSGIDGMSSTTLRPLPMINTVPTDNERPHEYIDVQRPTHAHFGSSYINRKQRSSSQEFSKPAGLTMEFNRTQARPEFIRRMLNRPHELASGASEVGLNQQQDGQALERRPQSPPALAASWARDQPRKRKATLKLRPELPAVTGSSYNTNADSSPELPARDRIERMGAIQEQTRQDNLAEKRRREHEEYMRKRDTDPTFIPNRKKVKSNKTKRLGRLEYVADAPTANQAKNSRQSVVSHLFEKQERERSQSHARERSRSSSRSSDTYLVRRASDTSLVEYGDDPIIPARDADHSSTWSLSSSESDGHRRRREEKTDAKATPHPRDSFYPPSLRDWFDVTPTTNLVSSPLVSSSRYTQGPYIPPPAIQQQPNYVYQRPVDVDKQGGVLVRTGRRQRRNIITRKFHSMGAKRAVPGRSLPYDLLLQQYKEKNQVKQQQHRSSVEFPYGPAPPTSDIGTDSVPSKSQMSKRSDSNSGNCRDKVNGPIQPKTPTRKSWVPASPSRPCSGID